jgi:tRNA-dihydrouridine synthase
MEKARQIISACAKATDKPITVKFRLGLDDKHIVATEFAKMCEEAGASAITVHGRTTAQGYSGKSDLEQIKKVASSVNIPVIASGDCVDKASFDHILAYTGAAAVMIGRASIGRSEIFAEVNGQTPKVDKFAQIREHIELLKTVYPDKVVALSMRGIICHYLKNISGTTLAKVQISKMTTTAEMLEYLKNFFKTQKGQ